MTGETSHCVWKPLTVSALATHSVLFDDLHELVKQELTSLFLIPYSRWPRSKVREGALPLHLDFFFIPGSKHIPLVR